MRRLSPVANCAIASGSSGVPTTPSRPGGRTIVARNPVTTRFDPPGAALDTISITLKYWLRKPMSPGMTMTPGMGGTPKSWPLRSGIDSEKPMTVRLGICVWSFSVSGMIVLRLGIDGVGTDGMAAWLTLTSAAP